jgi:Spy/CpxP family protein refolding chaperone
MSRIHAVALGAALLLGVSGIAGIAGSQGQKQGQNQGQRQGVRGPGYGMRHRGGFQGRMAKDLNLTDAQKTQIKAIREKYRSQFESIRSQVRPQAGTPGAMRLKRDSARVLRQKGDTAWRGGFGNISPELRQRMLTLRSQEQGEIRNVLTAEQRVKFDAAQAQRKQQMENRVQKRGARPQRG